MLPTNFFKNKSINSLFFFIFQIACGTLDTKILIFEINNNKKNQKGGNKFTKDKPIAEMMGHSGSISCL